MSKSKPRPKSPVPRRKRYEPTPPPPSRSTIKKEKWRATPTVQPRKANTPVVKTEDETEPSAPLGKLPSAPLQTQPSLSPKVVAGPPPGLEATARYDWANFENGTGPAPDMVFSVYTNHNTEAYITPSKSRTQSINDGARSYDPPQRATTNESSSSQRKRKRGSAEAGMCCAKWMGIELMGM
jgi:hypothetical protein